MHYILRYAHKGHNSWHLLFEQLLLICNNFRLINKKMLGSLIHNNAHN